MKTDIKQLLSSHHESEQRIIMANILNGLFTGEIPVEDLFSPLYQQCSDGNTLDFTGFSNHLLHLRKHLKKVEFVVLDACVFEDRLAERHITTVTHQDGQVSEIEVYVFMRLQHYKIISLDEITHVISGEESDKTLASATS